jgi:hypothetical protein
MGDELVFTVTGESALPASSITLSEAGLKEREHLQEWVIAHPEILGPGVLVITSEFDRWHSRAGAERDRLDVLGLASDGHLVVAELKRDTAPDTVEMQAIKYAALASRFDAATLADAYVEFQRRHYEKALTNEEAIEALAAHTEYALSEETLRAPRILLIAGKFPTGVTATAVWLSEMGLDITLTRVQAYSTTAGTVITVSQHYPPADVEDFLVAPTRSAQRARSSPEMPAVEWTAEDYARLAAEVPNVTILATLDLCSTKPGEWIPSEEVQARTGRAQNQHRGDYGGFGVTLRTKFKRSNQPFAMQWAAGGTNQQYYKVTPEQADLWSATTNQATLSSPPGEST